MITLDAISDRLVELRQSKDRIAAKAEELQGNLSAHNGAIAELERLLEMDMEAEAVLDAVSADEEGEGVQPPTKRGQKSRKRKKS